MDLHSLSSLAGLPDSVKRNIMQRIAIPQENEIVPVAAAPDDVAAAPQLANVAELCKQLSGRQLILPPMAAGAVILDNVLLLPEVQAACAAVEAWLAQHGRRPGMGSSKAAGLWHDSSYRGDIHCWVTATELAAAQQPLLAACLQLVTSLRPQLAAQGYDVSGRCSCQLACYPGSGARYVCHTDASPSAPDRSVTALLYLNPNWDPQADGGQLALYNAAHSLASHNHSCSQPASCPTTAVTPNSHSSVAVPDSSTNASMTDSCSSSQYGVDTGQHAADHQTNAAATAAACTGGPSSGFTCGEPALLVAPVGGRLLVFDSRLPHEVLPAHRMRYSFTVWFYKQHTPQGTGPAQPATPATPQLPPPAALPATQPPRVCAGGPPATSTLTAQQLSVSADEAAEPQPAQEGSASTAAARSQGSGGTADQADSTDVTDSAAAAAVGPAAAPADSRCCQLPSIFVSIASFRDEECQWTLRDLFLTATHPERVFVGVVWQLDPQADASFVRMAGGSRTAVYLAQVRECRVHYSTATGPCAARSMAQQLWAGEDFVLQVDAHMRFVQGWDEQCLSEWQAAREVAGHERVVLSTYPLGYDGEGPAAAVPDDAPATLLCAKEFDGAGLLRVQSRCLRQRPTAPLLSHFWAAGLSFAPASWLLEVPYCPHLPHLFFGEEQYMLLRMWTRGWDVYAPTAALAFHQWERKARPNSYQACVKVDAAARAASQARVLGLSSQAAAADGGRGTATPSGADAPAPHSSHGVNRQRLQLPSDQDWSVGSIWGLGTARSLQLYEQRAGVSFAQQLLEPKALHGGLSAALFES